MSDSMPRKQAVHRHYGMTMLVVVLALVSAMFMIYRVFRPDLTGFFRSSPADARIGKPVDSLHGVNVYFNGPVSNVSGRNRAGNGYNLGLKYQCVEFVKRYYYLHYRHQMPDSYGHAVEFYEPDVPDGRLNPKRNLIQYANPGSSKPEVGDIVVFSGTPMNPYGHVAIVADVTGAAVEIIQQNPGPNAPSRVALPLTGHDGRWKIASDRILGWLRKPNGATGG